MGTGQAPAVRRRQQEGYPPTPNHTRRTDILTRPSYPRGRVARPDSTASPLSSQHRQPRSPHGPSGSAWRRSVPGALGLVGVPCSGAAGPTGRRVPASSRRRGHPFVRRTMPRAMVGRPPGLLARGRGSRGCRPRGRGSRGCRPRGCRSRGCRPLRCRQGLVAGLLRLRVSGSWCRAAGAADGERQGLHCPLGGALSPRKHCCSLL